MKREYFYEIKSELITPEMAENWLKLNTKNRTLDNNRAKKIAEQMLDGKWIDTGVPIIFEAGKLTDGQHRLAAIVYAKKPVRIAVARHEKQLDIFAVVDVNRPRTKADALHYVGYANSKDLVSTLRNLSIWQYAKDEAIAAGSKDVSHSRLYHLLRYPGSIIAQDNNAIIKMADRFPAIEESVTFGVNHKSQKNKNNPLSRSKWAFFHYTLKSVDSDKADRFLEALNLGSGAYFASSGSPLSQLREHLIAKKMRPTLLRDGGIISRDIAEDFLHVFSAWNAVRGHSTYKSAKLNLTSPIPIPR